MHRGEPWWATLGETRGRGADFRRPLLVLQSDDFNQPYIRGLDVESAPCGSTRRKFIPRICTMAANQPVSAPPPRT